MIAAAALLAATIGVAPALTTDDVRLLDAPAEPRIIGVVKRLEQPIVTDGSAEIRTSGGTHVRIHLEDVDAPNGATFVVRGDSSATLRIAPGTHDVWLPLVEGNVAAIDVQPAVRFRIAEVAVLRLGALAESPYVDAACISDSEFPGIERARHAVAQLTFIIRGRVAHCTGTLLADRASSGTPNLLTANHCIDSQDIASTVQAFFDDYSASCGGPAPPFSQLPSVVGATFLATASPSDATLLRLSGVPPGRTFLPVDRRPEAVAAGTQVFRLSHPVSDSGVYPQMFTAATISATPPSCQDADRFVESVATRGATGPGSSGAALLTANGSVVGQVRGSCDSTAGPENSVTHAIDGLISSSWPKFAPFLDTPPPARRRTVRH